MPLSSFENKLNIPIQAENYDFPKRFATFRVKMNKKQTLWYSNYNIYKFHAFMNEKVTVNVQETASLTQEKLFNETLMPSLSFTAPGAYDVDKADKKVHESSPAYSIGVKHKDSKPDDIPGRDILNKTDY